MLVFTQTFFHPESEEIMSPNIKGVLSSGFRLLKGLLAPRLKQKLSFESRLYQVLAYGVIVFIWGQSTGDYFQALFQNETHELRKFVFLLLWTGNSLAFLISIITLAIGLLILQILFLKSLIKSML